MNCYLTEVLKWCTVNLEVPNSNVWHALSYHSRTVDGAVSDLPLQSLLGAYLQFLLSQFLWRSSWSQGVNAKWGVRASRDFFPFKWFDVSALLRTGSTSKRRKLIGRRCHLEHICNIPCGIYENMIDLYSHLLHSHIFIHVYRMCVRACSLLVGVLFYVENWHFCYSFHLLTSLLSYNRVRFISAAHFLVHGLI